jgi:hypothetical protein
MADFQVSKIKTEPGFGDGEHEHIAAVELDYYPQWRFSRDVIIRNLRSPTGDRYYVFVGGDERRAEVVVGDCPFCSFGAYLTTVADSTTADHLLRLPRFFQ